MKILKTVAATAALTLTATQAQAVLIDFSDRTNGFNTTAFVYPEATFTSASGTFVVITAGIQQKTLCGYDPNSDSCLANVTVDFAQGVSNLSFEIFGDNTLNAPINVEVFVGGVSVGLSSFLVDGTNTTSQLASLAAFNNVTRLVLDGRADANGVAYDNFSFDVTVPEPDSLALLGAGLVGLGLYRSRRR